MLETKKKKKKKKKSRVSKIRVHEMTTTSTVVLPLDGCFEDSPFFRADLALVEQNTGDFEATAKSLLKLARTGVDSSRGTTCYK